jgi:hypothetical protein
MKALFPLAVMAALFAAPLAVADPDTESFGPAQAAADVLRAEARAQIAFLPAGVLKPGFKSGELAAMLQFPTDDIAVAELTGRQVRQALERSCSLHPSLNPGFLQLSGLTVTFSTGRSPGSRIVEASVSGAALNDGEKYRVAMPGSLARGGLGYFTVWKKEQIVETLPGRTMEAVLKGRSGSETAPRWRAVP